MTAKRLKRLALLLAVAGIGLGIVIWRPLVTHVKTLLLLSQEFPQVPLKPLGAVSTPPVHEQLTLASAHGPLNADLFLPTPRFGSIAPNSRPAVILAMGVKTREEDRGILLGFAQTLSRLGFVVLWPRLEPLDRGVSLPEEPATFVAGFHYLEGIPIVDRERIAIMGFSVGSSIAFVAGAQPPLADRLRALVFFGGYYNILDYVVSVASRSFTLDGQESPWEPAEGATSHVQEILTTKEAGGLLRVMGAGSRAEAEARLRAAPSYEVTGLKQYSPSEYLTGFKARLFILHDRGDPYVPYVESVKLSRALGGEQEKSLVLTSAFEHVEPRTGVSWDIVAELLKVYGFIYQVLRFL